jgi:SAM-dependent methyltransferase
MEARPEGGSPDGESHANPAATAGDELDPAPSVRTFMDSRPSISTEALMTDLKTADSAARTVTGYLPVSVVPSDEGARDFLAYSGMMPEGNRLWTLGPASMMAFALPRVPGQSVLIRFDLAAFVWQDVLPRQRVRLRMGDMPLGEWLLTDGMGCRRAIAIDGRDLPASGIVALSIETPDNARPADLGVNNDIRPLGIAITRVQWSYMADYAQAEAQARRYGRRVGNEARKSFDDKLDAGFWGRFITGPNVLDIGFRGYDDDIVPIVEGAIGIDLDYPGYDGTRLPFDDGSQDTVFSSHCLEHIPNHTQVIQDWFRVTRVGGHVITVVPNAMLYERKRRPPSRQAGWNHLRFYTPRSLLAEFESTLVPNSYRVRHLAENDANYRYDFAPDRHPDGCYEIELVIQKIVPPDWRLDD